MTPMRTGPPEYTASSGTASFARESPRGCGRGLPGTPPGDQIVELEVLAPKAHDEKQRDAYATMRDAFGDDWRRA